MSTAKIMKKQRDVEPKLNSRENVRLHMESQLSDIISIKHHMRCFEKCLELQFPSVFPASPMVAKVGESRKWILIFPNSQG
jgi:hypothetical protein